MLAVYIPIIRTTIGEYRNSWNYHRIQKQPKRPYVVYGRPRELYKRKDHPEVDDFGLEVNPNLWAQIDQTLDGFDIDEYLPQATIQWCQDIVRSELDIELGDVTGGMVWEGSEDGSEDEDEANRHIVRRTHNVVYTLLQERLSTHFRTGAEPILLETAKPLGGPNWVPTRSEDEFQNRTTAGDQDQGQTRDQQWGLNWEDNPDIRTMVDQLHINQENWQL